MGFFGIPQRPSTPSGRPHAPTPARMASCLAAIMVAVDTGGLPDRTDPLTAHLLAMRDEGVAPVDQAARLCGGDRTALLRAASAAHVDIMMGMRVTGALRDATPTAVAMTAIATVDGWDAAMADRIH